MMNEYRMTFGFLVGWFTFPVIHGMWLDAAGAFVGGVLFMFVLGLSRKRIFEGDTVSVLQHGDHKYDVVVGDAADYLLIGSQIIFTDPSPVRATIIGIVYRKRPLRNWWKMMVS